MAAVLAAALLSAPAAASAAKRPVAVPSKRSAAVAKVVSPTYVYEGPLALTKRLMRVGTHTRWGGDAVGLLVLDSAIGFDGRTWLKVLLPVRPNGATGWIADDKVVMHRTRWRIEVSLRRRSARVYHDGRLARRFPVVVGAPGAPTPRGLFAIRERVRQPNPRGYLGPWVLHLTGFSHVLEDFGGGPGRIGIHGRDGASLLDPLGTARSHGCVRVDDRIVRWLARVAEPGTPVRISR